MSKLGTPFAMVDPRKIVAVIEHSEPDGVAGFDAPDEFSEKIAEHVVKFLADELRAAGRIRRSAPRR